MKTKTKKKYPKYVYVHQFYNRIDKLIRRFEKVVGRTVIFNLEVRK